MASKSGFELLSSQKQEQQEQKQGQEQKKKLEQQMEENYVDECQSHGTLKAQSLTSSGCCAFFPGVDQIVEQGCFGAPVFIDGLAPPSVGVMSVLVPMENVVALQVSMLLLVLLLSVTRLVLVLLLLLLTMFVWVLGL